MDRLIMQFSPASHHFIPLRSTSSQCLVFETDVLPFAWEPSATPLLDTHLSLPFRCSTPSLRSRGGASSLTPYVAGLCVRAGSS
jgi:hypothetical protein